MVGPVALGGGKRIWPSDGGLRSFTAGSEPTSTGALLLTCTPGLTAAGSVPTVTETDQPGVRARLAPLGRRLARRAVGYPAALLTGAALLYVPIHTGNEQDRWAEELRERGRPAQAFVSDVRTKNRGTTMYFRYELDGVSHEREVACVEVCLSGRSTAPIWVSRTDPGDFVTDFGQLSGHRGRFQGVVGAAGFVILAFTLAGLVIDVRGRREQRALTRRPTRAPRLERSMSMPRSKHKRARGGRPND